MTQSEDLKLRIATEFAMQVPHNRALGMEVNELTSNSFTMKLPYAKHLVGDPDSGVLHGGCITALMDACCGGAVMVTLPKLVRIATLDLRIDYLRAAKPPHDVSCRAECYKLTRQVAFVRAHAFDQDAADPIAHATGTFMIFPSEDEAKESHA